MRAFRHQSLPVKAKDNAMETPHTGYLEVQYVAWLSEDLQTGFFSLVDFPDPFLQESYLGR